MKNELPKNEQPCIIHSVSGSLLSKTYEIDFGGNLKCKIRVCGNELEIEAATNGWGNEIPCSEISVVELQRPLTLAYEKYTYECKDCGKLFGDKLSLYEHYNEEHN